MPSYFPNHPNPVNPKPPSEHERLFELARKAITIVSEQGQAFISLSLGDNGHQVWPVRSPQFRDWLVHTYIEQYDALPRDRTISSAIRAVEAAAHCAPQLRSPVFRRVAAYGPRTGPAIPAPVSIALDLTNDQGEVIDITAEGWQLSPGETHCFLRTRGAQSLPAPVGAGANHPPPRAPARPPLPALRSLLPPISNDDHLRIIAWLLSTLSASPTFPVLILAGPPGSGKSTAAHMLRNLIDPATAPFTQHSCSDRELLATARRNWIIAFDHVHRLSARFSAALCRLSSGAGFSLRQPHDPREPVPFHLQRPIILTLNRSSGATLGDPALADRALIVNLKPIPAAARRPESDIWREFEKLRPQLLGALCTAVATALRRLPEIKLETAPRLADAAVWAAAAAPALGVTEEEILYAFDPEPGKHAVVEAVSSFMEDRATWAGSATELHALLAGPGLPPTPEALAQLLRRQLAHLARAGVEVAFARLPGGDRRLTLKRPGCDSDSPASLSQTPDQPSGDNASDELSAGYQEETEVAHKMALSAHRCHNAVITPALRSAASG